MQIMKNPWLRLIGDAHGKYEQYYEWAKDAEYSIQLGDLGFDYSILDKLDATKNKVLGGNHDSYLEHNGVFIKQTPHFLGDFGVHTIPDLEDVFFVRGGYSIDKNQRTEGFDWFYQEQLSTVRMHEALQLYKEKQPNFVITHECPVEVIEYVSGIRLWDGEPIRPSKTAHLLQSMFEECQPKLWVFGHHHKRWTKKINGTEFICLEELGVLDFSKDAFFGL